LQHYRAVWDGHRWLAGTTKAWRFDELTLDALELLLLDFDVRADNTSNRFFILVTFLRFFSTFFIFQTFFILKNVGKVNSGICHLSIRITVRLNLTSAVMFFFVFGSCGKCVE